MLHDFKPAGGDWTCTGKWRTNSDPIYGEAYVTSKDWALRHLRISLSKLATVLKVPKENLKVIEFEVYVKGTPPDCADPFKIYVRIAEGTRRLKPQRCRSRLLKFKQSLP